MTPVKSNSLAAIGHDAATNTLKVQFANGGTYHFKDVPASEHAKLMAAKSIGSHFQANIRTKYKGTRA